MDELKRIGEDALKKIQAAADLKELNDARVAYLGKKSPIQAAMKQMRDMSKEERANFGKISNEVKQSIAKKVEAKKAELEALALEAKIQSEDIDISGYDYIVDAIDTVTSKLILIENASRFCVPIISSMGTGNKLDPTRFEITDIYKTSVCPLAKVMRKELKDRGIKKLKVLYSKEEPIKPLSLQNENPKKRQTPGSMSFVPSVAGLIIAGEVIKDLIK